MNAPARILIDGQIESGFAAKLKACLEKYSGPVELHLRSAGGDAIEGFAAAHLIKARGDVSVVIMHAASAATFPVAAASHRAIFSDGTLMLHSPYFVGGSGIQDQKVLAVCRKRMVALYCERARNGEQIRSQIENAAVDFFYEPYAAWEAGLVDQILTCPPCENFHEIL
jgi:ATP-dependent protease ClpP protease subunit